MNIKFLQLNLALGKYFERVIKYINNGNFDIITLQEVAGGAFSSNNRNDFEELVRRTGLVGQLAEYANTPGSILGYLGNAVLYKHRWRMLSEHTIWMKRYMEIPNKSLIDPRKVPRCALSVLLEKNGQQVLVMSTHLVWGPTAVDAVYKRNPAEKLYRWVQKHQHVPFILAGDFNLNPKTKIISEFNRLGNNLTKNYKISNTLNPRTHYAKHLFPSGLPVDYVFTDTRIKVQRFRVDEAHDLSDHFGLIADLEFRDK